MKTVSLLFLPLLILLSGSQVESQIRVGQAAPPLRLTQLLQAPPGTRTDWPSLRGKVVVLEFWATWCSFCIQQIPHLNSIVRSVGSGQVQFIAIDDEPVDTEQRFVAKIPMSGWLGIDTTGRTIRSYGAETRPRSVVVDPAGRIAAILDPGQLTGVALLKLATGRKVEFPVNGSAAGSLRALNDAAELEEQARSGGTAVVDLSLRRGDPKGQTSIVDLSRQPDGPVKLDAINVPLLDLTGFMGLPRDRIRLKNLAGGGTYSLHLAAPSGTVEQFGPAIQMAVASAAKLHLVRTNADEDVWVIQKTPESDRRLHRVAPGQGHLCMYDPATGKLILEYCSLDNVAEALEELGMTPTPVLNETGIQGEISAVLDLAAPDADQLRDALEQNLGLILIRARRRVERIRFEP
jgi:thiol-disulfide isomerase/thioredoxin